MNKPIIKKWNTEMDIIAPPLEVAVDWAYLINTTIGQYRMEIKRENVVERINDKSEILYTEEICNLILRIGEEVFCVMENVTVWPTNYYKSFMIFHANKTGYIYLIDSRGIIFELPCKTGVGKKWEYGKVGCNKREGYYLINDEVKVYYRSNMERKEFQEKSMPVEGVLFNKEFNRFVRNNTHNETNYLYLTAGDNKCGALVKYFASLGMKYERVPNVLSDDETINVRIPLDDENMRRKDVQFLCAKYFNTYSIYGIPYKDIGGGLEFTEKYKKLWYESGFSMPKGKEAMIYSVVDTIRASCKAKDDYDLYKKCFAKIKRLLTAKVICYKNCFKDIYLLHPCDVKLNDEYILSHLDYINDLLSSSAERQQKAKEFINIDVLRSKHEGDFAWLQAACFNKRLYQTAFEESILRYKDAMKVYESNILAKITEQGIKISCWKSESALFSLVKKEYSDAIYQYHSEWLGLQSLDIFIPSLSVGIEYQGQQHYEPVEVFGGEEAFAKTIARDEKKKMLCEKNNVHLILWKYDEVISLNKLKKKIAEIKNNMV